LKTLEVTGVFDTGLYEYDNSFVFLSLDTAQQLAQLGDAVTGLEVRTATRDDAGAVGRRLTDSLGAEYHIVDWQQQNAALFSALNLEKLGMAVILLIIVIVSAFNITN